MKKDPNRHAPRHSLPRAPLVFRSAFILQYCTGKRILHLGCADWPFTEQLFREGQLLHQKLEITCAAIAGVDISEKGI